MKGHSKQAETLSSICHYFFNGLEKSLEETISFAWMTSWYVYIVWTNMVIFKAKMTSINKTTLFLDLQGEVVDSWGDRHKKEKARDSFAGRSFHPDCERGS